MCALLFELSEARKKIAELEDKIEEEWYTMSMDIKEHSYSEGNTYRPINKWTLFTRDSDNEPWSVLRVTEDKDEVDLYVIKLNDKSGFQRYAVAQHTV